MERPGRVAAPIIFILGATLNGQAPAPSEYVAFRADAERVVATLLVEEGKPPQVTQGFSQPPVARLGYRYFDPPRHWSKQQEFPAGDRWLIHTAPGQVFDATVERHVGGYVGCDQGRGVLLRVAPQHAKMFSGVTARYFIATPAAIGQPGNATTVDSAVWPLAISALTRDLRQSIESILNGTLERELPKVQKETAPSLAHELEGPYRASRTWARERLQIEDALKRGEGRLQYDAQPFQLAPDGVPVLFVRATWLVGKQQAFAAALWLRAGPSVEVLDTNVWPAAAMRYSLFRNGVAPSHLGLILNVLDRDRDGWGEVLFSTQGYESESITLLEYSAAGFQKGVGLSGGC